MDLYPWQIPAGERMLQMCRDRRIVLNLSDTGTGKTVVTCWAAAQAGLKLIVVCPRSVVPGWTRTAKAFGVPIKATNYEQLTAAKHPPFGKWVMGKRFFLWRDDLDLENSILVFDEAHRLAGMDTYASRLLVRAPKANLPQPHTITLLSATMVHTPLKTWGIGKLFGLHAGKEPVGKIPGWTDYLQRLHCKYNDYQRKWICRDPSRAMKTLHSALADNIVRIKIEDLGDQFPEDQVTTLVVPVPQTQFFEHPPEAWTREQEMGQHQEFRKELEMAMIRSFIELGYDCYEQGRCPVIFVNFRDPMEAIRDGLKAKGLKVSHMWGSEDYSKSVSDFQGGRTDAMVATIQAGGVGVDLHDVCGRPRTSFISPTWDPVLLRQAFGRIRRSGSRSKSLQRIVFSDHEFHDSMIRTVESKLRALDTLNDGDLAYHVPRPN